MGHRVGLQVTRPVHVVIVGTDGDLVLEQSSGAGAAQALATITSPLWLEQSSMGSGSDLRRWCWRP